MRAMEERHGTVLRLRARGGIVLSTGGFAYSRALIDRTDSEFARHYDVTHRLSTMGNDGSGLEMGLSAGGAVGRMESLYIARNIAPPEALLDGVIVKPRRAPLRARGRLCQHDRAARSPSSRTATPG